MRRTRHVVLPVRSWQYIGLLLVSLACVTFGLVARDREGQAGSLTGPELLHRAPHKYISLRYYDIIFKKFDNSTFIFSSDLYILYNKNILHNEKVLKKYIYTNKKFFYISIHLI